MDESSITSLRPCGRCGEWLPIEQFHRRGSAGRMVWCKACKKAYDADYHARHRRALYRLWWKLPSCGNDLRPPAGCRKASRHCDTHPEIFDRARSCRNREVRTGLRELSRGKDVHAARGSESGLAHPIVAAVRSVAIRRAHASIWGHGRKSPAGSTLLIAGTARTTRSIRFVGAASGLYAPSNTRWSRA